MLDALPLASRTSGCLGNKWCANAKATVASAANEIWDVCPTADLPVSVSDAPLVLYRDTGQFMACERCAQLGPRPHDSRLQWAFFWNPAHSNTRTAGV